MNVLYSNNNGRVTVYVLEKSVKCILTIIYHFCRDRNRVGPNQQVFPSLARQLAKNQTTTWSRWKKHFLNPIIFTVYVAAIFLNTVSPPFSILWNARFCCGFVFHSHDDHFEYMINRRINPYLNISSTIKVVNQQNKKIVLIEIVFKFWHK